MRVACWKTPDRARRGHVALDQVPEAAPDTPTYIELTYRKGDIVAIDGKDMTPAQVPPS